MLPFRRYLEPEVDEHAGPVRKSQGADLAQLLEGAEAYDSGYYHRSRVNLLQEYGLPPADALSYQVLVNGAALASLCWQLSDGWLNSDTWGFLGWRVS